MVAGAGVCARAAVARHRSPRLPAADATTTLDRSLMLTSGPIRLARERARSGHGAGLRRIDREVHVASDRLVRDLVGHLDLEAILTLRERCQRHGLAGLQLMTG